MPKQETKVHEGLRIDNILMFSIFITLTCCGGSCKAADQHCCEFKDTGREVIKVMM